VSLTAGDELSEVGDFLRQEWATGGPKGDGIIWRLVLDWSIAAVGAGLAVFGVGSSHAVIRSPISFGSRGQRARRECSYDPIGRRRLGLNEFLPKRGNHGKDG